MSSTPPPRSDIHDLAKHVPVPSTRTIDGVDIKGGEDYSEKLVDQIEMLGEETAAGFRPPTDHGDISPGMRYLHCSRTIHQLVTDRNRAVGIYLAVASLLLTASGAIFHANPTGDLIVPAHAIQRWCLPLTFVTLAVLAVLIALLLVRTRVGLIYEVAKMNALLGLPVGRVKRVNVLSIFYVMHLIVSLGGSLAAGLFAIWMFYLAGDPVVWPGVLIGIGIFAALQVLYVGTVLFTTSDWRLEKIGK